MDLSTEQLRFGYDRDREILDGLTLAFRPGRLFVLLGANGSGKSTLLKLLAGLLTPTAGTIFLDGRDMRQWPTTERARHIALLLQNPPPVFDLPVRDFVLCGRTPKLPRLRRPDIADWQAVDNALERLQLTPFAQTSIRELSGGEYQRCRLAAALALESETLLLDEPTTAQDPKFMRLFGEILSDLKTTHTLLAVTHDLTWAETFADEILLLKDGHILAHGTPADTLTPDNLKRAF